MEQLPPRHYALRETGIVEIESEWTARDREQKARGGGERIFLPQVSAQTRSANLGHQASLASSNVSCRGRVRRKAKNE